MRDARVFEKRCAQGMDRTDLTIYQMLDLNHMLWMFISHELICNKTEAARSLQMGSGLLFTFRQRFFVYRTRLKPGLPSPCTAAFGQRLQEVLFVAGMLYALQNAPCSDIIKKREYLIYKLK